LSVGTLRRNAIWNLAEVAGSSVVLFVLYKLILKHLGVSALGIWSLVLATTSLARVADLGAAGGLGRYVALAHARNEAGDEALSYVETALIANAGFYILLGAVLYYPAWWGLGLTTQGAATVEARALLPFAIGAFVLQNVANVVTAALTGFHKSYQKSALTLLTLLVQATVALLTVQTIGLRGVALAQIVQYALTIIFGWWLSCRAAGASGIRLPYQIRVSALRELMGFGLRLQALNISSFLFDPFTKFAFSSVGGLQALGMYELASRGILQVRQLVVAPSQNLTPLFAAAQHQNPDDIRTLFERALATIIVAAGAAMLVMGLGSPLISLIWLRHVDHLFVLFSLLLAMGWFFNMISTPGYLMGVGVGCLRWNIVGSLVSTLGSPALGVALAVPFGGLGVAAGAMIAISAGGVVTWLLNCRSLAVPPLPSKSAWLGLLRSAEGLRARAFKLGKPS
jgi:O-antigen/teichoic acid export membrane protein